MDFFSARNYALTVNEKHSGSFPETMDVFDPVTRRDLPFTFF
jgi:hypothetical protein